ncbi:MAG TPA: hypothetical protein VLT45_22435 [Kofleriaceae bacterium]|nr:hypothetical protein [Kofleriaceae bacterium]
MIFPRYLMLPVFAAGCIAPVLAAGCVTELPPRPVPPAVVPPMQPAPPPPDGQARLVVDVADGPTPVARVRMAPQQVGSERYRFSEAMEPFCSPSPCAVDLPFGNVLLGFPRIGQPGVTEVELVHVGPESSVYRRSLSIYRHRHGALTTLGILATSIGGASAITGTVLLPVGLSDSNGGLTTAGGITLGAGAVLIALGVLAMRADADLYQPGAIAHFPLQP